MFRAFLSKIILAVPVFLLLLATAYFLYKKRKLKAGKILLGTAIVFLTLISTPFLPNYLTRQLENQYPPFIEEQVHQQNVVILVLGGGHTDDDRLPPNGQLSTKALARLIEGIRLHIQLPGSTLMVSGGKGRSGIPQAVVLKKTAILLGVDSLKINTQTTPENTWNEALEYKKRNNVGSELILVTSALHMPRAVYLFKKAGLNPIPAPTDFTSPYSSKKSKLFWMPSSRNISKLDRAIHEYVGLLWYKLGGS